MPVSVLARLAFSVAVASVTAQMPAAADTIRTKAPQEHVDAFMTGCKAKGVPSASCSCMLKKLSETKEGDAALDVVGLTQFRQNDTERKAALVPLLNRHGLRLSQLKAIMAPNSPLMANAAKQCE